MCKARIFSEEILTTFEEVEKEWERINNEIHRENLLMQDLVHECEDSRFNLQGAWEFYNELRENRKRRRRLLNERETMEYLVSFTREQRRQLENIQKGIVNKEDMQKGYYYTPRIKKNEKKESHISIAK